jgi:O-antigen ligase
MSNVSTKRFDPRAAGLLLAGGMCVIPFLQPRHMPPIGTFYDEWLAFAFGVAAMALTACARRNSATRMPTLILYLVFFSLALFARAICELSGYAQSSLLWGIYVLFAALLVALGSDFAAQFGQERVCDALATFLLAGALANSIAGVLQVVSIPREIDSFVSHLSGMRAIGNVGQANLYANYLALGEASLVYLFSRNKIGKMATLFGGSVLVGAGALAASRGYVLYGLGSALLAYFAIRRRRDAEIQRLLLAAVILATSIILAQWLVPVGMKLLGFQLEGGFQRNTLSEWNGPLSDVTTHLRLVAWDLAWQMFTAAPWIGVGPNAFAGAAFAHGLPPEMADEVWTSPHNLILHLLAETGLVGAGLVCLGVCAWIRNSAGRFWRNPDLMQWFLLACAGVEFVHALIEYSLLYAHFLAVTAFVMGVSASSSQGVSIRGFAIRAIFASSAVAGALLLGTTLLAYHQFDLASPVATGRSLASDHELARDRNSLAELGAGLLAPRAELWLFLAFPLNTTELKEKVAVGDRVLRFWPSRDVVIRQSIFLALAGRRDEAVTLLKQGLRTYRNRSKEIAATVGTAPREAREVLQQALTAQGL